MTKIVLRGLLTFAFIGFVGASVFRAIEQPTGTVAIESGPRRYLTYVARPDAGPTFELLPGASHFRFVSYLHLPDRRAADTFDPLERHWYGLDFRVMADDELVHSQVIWFVTRKSKTAPREASWEVESAYYPSGTPGEPCDSRMVELDLNEHAAIGRTLEVRTIGVGSTDVEANLIGFTRFDRDPARIDWQLRTSAPSDPEFADALPWGVSDEAERRAMLAKGWRRQATLAAVESRALYTTGFRLELDETIAYGQPMGPSRGVAYNIVGPATVRIAAFSPDSAWVTYTLGTLDVSELKMSAVQRSIDLKSQTTISDFLHAAEDGAVAMEIPAGVHRAIQLTGGAAGTRVLVSVSSADAPAGDHPMIRLPSGVVLLRPDVVQFPTWELREQPLLFQVGDRKLRAGDGVMISTRHESGSEPATVLYQFDDDPLGQLANGGPPSLFDVVSPLVAAPGAPTSDTLLSQPTHHRIWIPAGAKTLRVWSEDEPKQWINASVIAIDKLVDPRRRPPYDQIPPGLSWRYAPFLEHPWHGIGPEMNTDSERASRRWELRGQVRWDADPKSELSLAAAEELRATTLFEAPPVPEVLGEALTVDAVAPSVVLIDRAPLGPLQWSEAHRVRMTSDAPIQCDTTGEMRAVLHGRRGSVYTVRWNGKVRRRRILRTDSDQFTFRVPEGPGELSLQTRSRTLEMWVNCRPRRNQDVWILRRAYMLSRSRDLRLTVGALEDSWTLNAVIYGPSSGAVQATIDRGKPKRRSGPVAQLTRATRTVEWADVALTTRDSGRASARLSSGIATGIAIGSDLEPGKHRLRLRWQGARDEVAYVRFFKLAASQD